jgi:hypothetical protein
MVIGGIMIYYYALSIEKWDRVGYKSGGIVSPKDILKYALSKVKLNNNHRLGIL